MPLVVYDRIHGGSRHLTACPIIPESDIGSAYCRDGGFGGFRGCVLARAANIFSPKEGGLLFWWGRVANPPNPETRRSSFDGSGSDALHLIQVHLTLPGAP